MQITLQDLMILMKCAERCMRVVNIDIGFGEKGHEYIGEVIDKVYSQMASVKLSIDENVHNPVIGPQ